MNINIRRSDIPTIFLIIMCLISCSREINLYKDGSVWFCLGVTDEGPLRQRFLYRNFIHGDTIIGNKKYLKLYGNNFSDDDAKDYYICGLRVEKNKIYYAPQNHEWELLIFDYDIMPGDIFEVYSTCNGFYGNTSPAPRKMKCKEKSTIESCGITYEVFTVAPVENWDESKWISGKWIKGMGTPFGPTDNFYMNCFGMGSRVYEVMVNGKIVWEDSVIKQRINVKFEL